jgi:23S rRNA (guanosine2251-2'-O)-methyltransferase
LTAVAGFDGHQGIALVVEPRTFAGLDDILARAVERGEPPFVLVMDSLEDPQNVGTLLRSAEAAGVHGVIFPTRRQAPLSPAAVKASAGAVEHLLLAPVDDLPAVLSDLRIRGLRIAAAEADAPLTADQADLRGPLAIIVGSEGQGLSPAVRRRADLAIRIPMRGSIGSLNAAVAGSILLFGAVAQRGSDEGQPHPLPTPLSATPDADEPSTAARAEMVADPETAALEADPLPSPQKRTRTRRVATADSAVPTTEEAAEPSAAEPTPPSKRTRTKRATAEATPAPSDAEPPARPKRARTKAAASAPEAPEAATEPASAEPVDELLPGPATASSARPRRSRKPAPPDPGRA